MADMIVSIRDERWMDWSDGEERVMVRTRSEMLNLTSKYYSN